MADASSTLVPKRAEDADDRDTNQGDAKRQKVSDAQPASAEDSKAPIIGETAEAQGTAPVASTSMSRDVSRRGESKQRKGKEKKDGGSWHRRGSRPDGAPATETDAERKMRLPKRQCALLIGYSGTGYNGMQIQPDGTPGVRTIEGTLFQALVKAGAVSEDNADDPVKVNLQRAARTDAGVHAAGNVVSMKIITVVPNLKERINAELPPEIRLWGFVRAQNSFNARTSCDSRKYTYFFPSYLMIPPKPGSGLARTFAQQSGTAGGVDADAIDPFWREGDPASTREEDMRRKKAWRVGGKELAALRAAAQKYEGTHNFHNFTVWCDYKDRSNQRHMKKIEVSEPTIHGETEWISVMFHGQSFMLHQRKMMCVLVLATRTQTPPQVISELYGPRTVFIPKMPSLGLLLEYPIFDSYNNKIGDLNKHVDESSQDYRLLIDFEAHREKIEDFKTAFIYNRMRSSEERSEVFDRWMRSVDSYAGQDLLYFNAQGRVPDTAVHQKGTKRSNPFREKRLFDATDFPILLPEVTVAESADFDEESDKEIDKAKLAEMEG